MSSLVFFLLRNELGLDDGGFGVDSDVDGDPLSITAAMVDLDGDGLDEVILIRAYAADGAALSVFKVSEAGLHPWLETPAIGQAFRWLNPAGFGDFDGDGQLEIAHVQTPHIGGILIINRLENGRLVEVARKAGVSNHAYKSRELSMSAVIDVDGKGRDAIVLPDQAGDDLVVARLEADEISFDFIPFDWGILKIRRLDDAHIEVLDLTGEKHLLSAKQLRR